MTYRYILLGLIGPFCTFLAVLFGAKTSPVAAETQGQFQFAKIAVPNGLSQEVADLALSSVICAARHHSDGQIDKLAIIDYSLPSTQKRFWLFDLKKSKLLLEDFVAHGKNTGENVAQVFSNTPGSLQSSLGLFRAGSRYTGKHGTSLRLIGLEPGFNDAAYERAIVIHGADYVDPKFIQKHQRLGRSFGCPALSPESAGKVIDQFDQGKGYLFAYYPDEEWLSRSKYLKACTNL